MSYETWSTTASENNAAAPNGAPEGMPPDMLNNTIREVMAQVRALYNAINDASALADSAVTTAKLADLAVTGAKIANATITLSKLVTGTAGAMIAYAETTGEAQEIAPGDTDTVMMGNGAGKPASMKNLFGIPKEWTKAQNFAATTLTDDVSISWDLEDNQVAEVTLADNRTLAAPTNMKDGGTYILIVKQDATGGRALAFDAAYKFPDGEAPVLSSAANAVDILTFISDGTSMYGAFAGNFS